MNDPYSGTIAAISTGMSNSGIGIVRMTGPDSFAIIDKVYRGAREKKLSFPGQSYHPLRIYL